MFSTQIFKSFLVNNNAPIFTIVPIKISPMTLLYFPIPFAHLHNSLQDGQIYNNILFLRDKPKR